MRPHRLIAASGATLILVVIATTAILLVNLRNRDLADREHVLENLTLVLSEEIDRSFQSIELIERSEIARMKSLDIASATEFRRQMSGYDSYQRLRNQLSALPYVDALVVTDADGKLVNFSRSWPAPDVKTPDEDPHEVFKAKPFLDSLVGNPIRSPVTGKWLVPISRKFTGPGDEFLGVVTGVIELQYFEQLFATVANGPHGTIAMFRRDGTLLVRFPRDEAAIGRSFPKSRFLTALTTSDHGSGQEAGMLDGRERLVSARGLANYPLALVATATVDDALANWQRGAIIMIVGALTIGLVVGGAVFLSIWIVGRKLREQNLQRDAALHNMSQGLVMFDAAARLVVCNNRYRELYNLPPDLARPGCPLVELLEYRVAAGSFSADPNAYVHDLRAMMAEGKTKKHAVTMPDGCTIAVVNRPMPGGGWLATHEDITEAKRQEASFLLLFNNNPVPMWVYDLESLRFLAVNDAATIHYGYSRAQFLALTVMDIRPIEERARFTEFLSRAGANQDRDQAWRHQKADGTLIDVAVYSRVLRYEGRVAALVAMVDVTERNRAELALAQASQALIEKQYAIDQALTVTITDAHGTITYVNENMCKISGYSRDELLGETHRVMKSGCHDAAFYRGMYQQITIGKVWRGEVCNKAKDGSLYWVDTTIVPQLGADGRPSAYMAIRVDITARKLAEAKISYMASHDVLTGLGNRAVLNEKLEEALARSRRCRQTFAILLLDLDGFKHVNDTLGHAAGDELLKQLARRLTSTLRDTDVVTRLGGDEFAIIQSAAPSQRDAAATLAARLLEIVAEPFSLVGQDITVGTSIGIVIVPDDGAAPGDLLQKADLALYRVKSEGRNNFRFFDQELSKGAMARLSLVTSLRTALSRGEFEVHYQPVFEAKTRRLCSVEALVRWRHPIEGLVPPERFIPLAEETGLIESLGAWVLRRACSDAAAWPADVKIAINLSPVQFRTKTLFDMILCELIDSGLPPERLEFEITESVLMQNNEDISVILQQLKRIGISIVLDDFGIGYSSLNYLTTFPFDKIKIDKTFTQGLTNRVDCAAIVASVLTLARGLDIMVTAEGVETQQQFDLLQAAGVHQLQGYFLARPCPAAELESLIAKISADGAEAA